MGWFRANRKSGGGLALFALALQLWLSFAHIHPEDIYGPAKLPLSSAAQIASPSAEAAKLRPAERASHHGTDICAICATIYLLSSSATPPAPQLQPPMSHSRPAEQFIPPAALFVAARRASFQSRAPPAA
ncbi:MAG TPA: hypothetical protein VMF32_10605 [Xanthobacteraceae bacterium]|nr:hypothetical protein [Xanthobacteraceae bacterium]